jgi:hypothetical protein
MQTGKPFLKGQTPWSQGAVTCLVGITGGFHGPLAGHFPNRTERLLQDSMPTVSAAKGQKMCYAFFGPVLVTPCTIGRGGARMLKVMVPDWLVDRSGSHKLPDGKRRNSASS